MYGVLLILTNYDGLYTGNLSYYEVPSVGSFSVDDENVKMWFSGPYFVNNIKEHDKHLH